MILTKYDIIRNGDYLQDIDGIYLGDYVSYYKYDKLTKDEKIKKMYLYRIIGTTLEAKTNRKVIILEHQYDHVLSMIVEEDFNKLVDYVKDPTTLHKHEYEKYQHYNKF